MVAIFVDWKVLLAWQFLAVLISGTGVFSELLSRRYVKTRWNPHLAHSSFRGINFPTTQGSLNYLLLSSFVFLLPRPGRENGVSSVSDNPRLVQVEARDTNVLRRWPFYKLHVPWWQYFLLAVADVEANYLLVLAYQYTTITSVQLLDCFTIPCVMVLSRLILRARYTWRHMIGALCCVCGLTLLVVSDVLGHRFNDSDSSSSDRAFGDLLVLLGAMLYAVSNLGQEYILKSVESAFDVSAIAEQETSSRQFDDVSSETENVEVVPVTTTTSDKSPLLSSPDVPRYSPTHKQSNGTHDDSLDEAGGSVPVQIAADDNRNADATGDALGHTRFARPDQARHEYLSQLGLFGTLISVVQMVVLERHRWKEAHADMFALLYVAGYTACIFTLYVGASALIQRSSVLVMNLSFLTSDFYSVVMALILFNAHLNALYFVAFTVIVGGLLLYHTSPTPTGEAVNLSHAKQDSEANQ